MLQPGPAQQMPPAKLKTIVQPRTEIATKFISPATATSNRSIPRAWVPPKGTPLQYMTHPVFSQMAAATTATFPQMTSATMTNIPQMVPASTTIFPQMAASPTTATFPQMTAATTATFPQMTAATTTTFPQMATATTATFPQMATVTTTALTPQPRTTQPRTRIPWKTKGVTEWAVEVVVLKRIWDPNYQEELRGKVMKVYDEGVEDFVVGLKRKFTIKLAKTPTWQTIQNRVIKVIIDHRIYRNKQKKVTGGGEDEDHLESKEDRDTRLERESLYDQVIKFMFVYFAHFISLFLFYVLSMYTLGVGAL